MVEQGLYKEAKEFATKKENENNIGIVISSWLVFIIFQTHIPLLK